MSFDLLDRLISDICATTQAYIENEEKEVKELGGLGALKGLKHGSAESQFSSLGEGNHSGRGKGEGKKQAKGWGKRPMSEGIHRAVC